MSDVLAERPTLRTTGADVPSAELIDALTKIVKEIRLRDAPRDATECSWAYGVGAAAMLGDAMTGHVVGLILGTVAAVNEVRKAC